MHRAWSGFLCHSTKRKMDWKRRLLPQSERQCRSWHPGAWRDRGPRYRVPLASGFEIKAGYLELCSSSASFSRRPRVPFFATFGSAWVIEICGGRPGAGQMGQRTSDVAPVADRAENVFFVLMWNSQPSCIRYDREHEEAYSQRLRERCCRNQTQEITPWRRRCASLRSTARVP
jgi:hypothetical protein